MSLSLRITIKLLPKTEALFNPSRASPPVIEPSPTRAITLYF